MTPDMCRAVDAWWQIHGEVTLLQVAVLGEISGQETGLFASLTHREEQRVHLMAVVDNMTINRNLFEHCMVLFAKAGFPNAPAFQLVTQNRYIKIGSL